MYIFHFMLRYMDKKGTVALLIHYIVSRRAGRGERVREGRVYNSFIYMRWIQLIFKLNLFYSQSEWVCEIYGLVFERKINYRAK